MPEMHLKQLGFTYSAYGPFTKKTKKEFKNLKKQEMQTIFTKMNWQGLLSVWLMEILKI